MPSNGIINNGVQAGSVLQWQRDSSDFQKLVSSCKQIINFHVCGLYV